MPDAVNYVRLWDQVLVRALATQDTLLPRMDIAAIRSTIASSTMAGVHKLVHILARGTTTARATRRIYLELIRSPAIQSTTVPRITVRALRCAYIQARQPATVLATRGIRCQGLARAVLSIYARLQMVDVAKIVYPQVLE